MRYVCIFLIMIYPFAPTANCTLAKAWREIKPLYSTRKDVERLLAVVSSGQPLDKFLIDGEEVVVEYSTGNCENDLRALWNVSSGVVVRLSRYPKPGIPLTSLALSIEKFRVSYSDVQEQLTFIDDDEGWGIFVDEGIVKGINYFPSANDSHLRCPNIAGTSNPKSRCNRTESFFDPSGSYYPGVPGFYNIDRIILSTQQPLDKQNSEGLLITTNGEIIKLLDVVIVDNKISFKTDKVGDAVYTFRGHWLINKGVFAHEKTIDGARLLDGFLERTVNGKSERGKVFFLYRPEC